MKYELLIRERTGYYATVEGTVTTGASSTFIPFSPAVSIIGSTMIGTLVYFKTGSNAGMAAYVYDETQVTTTVTNVTLDRELSSVPSNGDKVIFFKHTGTAFYSGEYIQINQRIESVSFDSSIVDGFRSLKVICDRPTRRLFSAIGYDVELRIDGNRVYQGILTNISIDGNKVELNAAGYKSTFNRFYYYNLYLLSTISTITVIKDICNQNPYLRYNKHHLIDYDDALHDAQIASGDTQFDFTDSDYTGNEALNKLLKLGTLAYGEYGLALQVWFDHIPTLQILENTTISKYYTKEYQSLTPSIEINGIDAYNIYGLTYDNEEGQSIYAPLKVDTNGLQTTPYELFESNSSITQETANLYIQTKNAQNMIRAGNVNLSEYVYTANGGQRIPSYLIRAGEQISLEGSLYEGSLFNNKKDKLRSFLIGNMSFKDGAVEIAPLEFLDKAELQIAQISIS